MKSRAFTLLEILVALAILGIIASILTPSLTQALLDRQLRAEDESLAQIKSDIIQSLDSDDFDSVNILPETDTTASEHSPVSATNTFAHPDLSFVGTNRSDWFAKIAAVRGTPYTADPPTRSFQPELSRLLFNEYGRARLLVIGPYEATRQRLLLVSLMAPRDQLDLPADDHSADWFNAVWSNNWDTKDGGLPAYWSGKLPAAQTAAWYDNGGRGTNLYRLRVVRITIPRCTLNITNNSTTYNGYIYYNADHSRVDSLARSGPTVIPGILAGRIIRVERGTSLPTAAEEARFNLRRDSDVFIQTGN